MGELNSTSSDLPIIQEQDNMPIPVEGKTLYITPKTKKFDYQVLLGNIIQCVSMGDILNKIKAGTQYVVQVPTEFQKALDTGELSIMKNKKTGMEWAYLMKTAENGQHQIVKPLPIAEQPFVQGTPLQDLVSGYHNLLMQQQLEEISAKLDAVLESVSRIEEGQMDDRIAMLDAGRAELTYALSIEDPNERIQQVVSSRSTLIKAQQMIGRALKRRTEEFEPLPRCNFKLYKRERKKNGYLRSKDSEFHIIQEYYDCYLQATKFIAASFAMSGNFNNANYTFETAEEFLSTIDFRNLKTIEYTHKGLKDAFYSAPVKYVAVEKEIYLDEAKAYDYIALEVSGEKLLEVLGDDRTEEIPESNTEQ